MISKPLYVDVNGLESYLAKSIYKAEFIIEQLGISRQAFYKKRKGMIPFRASEVYVLCDLLNISADERPKIFYPKG